MKKKPTELGRNRTGIANSPVDAAKLIEASRMMVPPRGDERMIHELREEYATEAEPIGTMPPATARGAAKNVLKLIKGERPTVFLDKLGERCAFERTGMRLYETLVHRFDGFGEPEGGPSIEQLRRFLAEEARHFEMLVDAIRSLGADPTTMTPCADVSAVASFGVIQLLSDPRTSPTQCLQAILIAELADRDGWELLIELAQAMSQEEMARRFQRALLEEEVHLVHVRRWLAEMTRIDANLGRERMPPDWMEMVRDQQRRIFELLLVLSDDGGEESVVELAAELQDEAQHLEALGQELVARSTTRM